VRSRGGGIRSERERKLGLKIKDVGRGVGGLLKLPEERQLARGLANTRPKEESGGTQAWRVVPLRPEKKKRTSLGGEYNYRW